MFCLLEVAYVTDMKKIKYAMALYDFLAGSFSFASDDSQSWQIYDFTFCPASQRVHLASSLGPIDDARDLSPVLPRYLNQSLVTPEIESGSQMGASFH